MLIPAVVPPLPSSQVHEALGGADLPLLWTLDFIVDTDSDGSDTWRIGEINCRCACMVYQEFRAPNNAFTTLCTNVTVETSPDQFQTQLQCQSAASTGYSYAIWGLESLCTCFEYEIPMSARTLEISSTESYAQTFL